MCGVQTPYPRVEQQWLAAQWRRLEADRAARAVRAAGTGSDSPTAAGDGRAPANMQVALTSERFSLPGGERLSEAGAVVQAGAGKATSFLKAGMKKGVAAVRARIGGAEDDDAHVRSSHLPPPQPLTVAVMNVLPHPRRQSIRISQSWGGHAPPAPPPQAQFCAASGGTCNICAVSDWRSVRHAHISRRRGRVAVARRTRGEAFPPRTARGDEPQHLERRCRRAAPHAASHGTDSRPLAAAVRAL